MSADKRSVSTDALETLGMIIDDTQKRDAIHLAVEPIEAGEKLYPNQDVGIVNGVAMASNAAGPVTWLGVVDPFLKAPVQEGQRFWLVVYPRQIHSLRHVWTHPAFASEPALAHIASAQPNKVVSEQWLRNFIDSSDCPDYHTVIGKALNNDSWSDEYLHFDGRDAHGEIPPEFYAHLEVVTGINVPTEKRATHFSCSC